MTERIEAAMTTDTLIAEYADLRSFGLSFEAAANRLGYQVRGLEKRFQRAGYRWREVV